MANVTQKPETDPGYGHVHPDGLHSGIVFLLCLTVGTIVVFALMLWHVFAVGG